MQSLVVVPMFPYVSPVRYLFTKEHFMILEHASIMTVSNQEEIDIHQENQNNHNFLCIDK